MPEFIAVEKFREQARKNEAPADSGLYKEFIAGIEGKDDDKRELLFTISTDSVDRSGDKIDQSGWQLDAYRKNPVVLWAHNYSGTPIARSNQIWAENGKLRSLTEFIKREISPFSDSVYRMYREGFLSAVSVGFLPKKYAFVEDKDRRFGIDFEEQELLEFSAVPVPANAEALIEARSAGIDLEPMREWARGMLCANGIKTIRELESFLRDAGGFSKSDAASLASHGWRGLTRGEPDVDAAALEVVQLITSELEGITHGIKRIAGNAAKNRS